MLVSPARRTLLRRSSAVVGAATLLVGAVALPASAHVTVTPDTVTQGSTQELTFKVPNEESNATTTEVQLQIPTDHPIAQVLPRAVSGWTITVHTVTLAKPLTTDDGTFTTAVNEIDWTGGSIPVNQYQDFQISVDPLPSDTTQLVFKAVQTYSNGDVVRWIDLPVAGQPEPGHPAPVLTLTAASGGGSGTAGVSGSSSTAATATGSTSGSGSTTTAASSSSDGDATAALWLGGLGLAAGLAALVLTLLNRRRSS
jgi:uncharacterized protein YcnI